ncbi:hypothetical protein VNO78_03046 [Psophocarpus tetragonolobus]|uniref:GH18 domain-containing protein n=1 Tax=Psophocarpus tetragonolobus TaxID=3891 RepID=A0AAN9TCE8_PSOTE
MEKTKKQSLGIAISSVLMIVAEASIKGGYWFSGSGMAVADINPNPFTHLFCAFANIDSTTFKVTISSSDAYPFSIFTQTVQGKNPCVRTLLSIGGGGGPAIAAVFSQMATTAGRRKAFIDSSISVARANNFHGIDVDWEYPSSSTDKTNFGALTRELRAAVNQEALTSGKSPLLLAAAVAGSDQISPLQYYPGPDITNNLDIVNAMTYDLFPSYAYPTSTQPPAPLYNPQGLFSADQGINQWLNTLGVPPYKLALGLPFYGYKWTLSNPSVNGLFAPTTQGLGAIKYKDIKAVGATPNYNASFVTNYCYNGTNWYGYDDVDSIKAKVSYAKIKGLLGYFAWNVEQDNNWALSQAASTAWGV